MDSIRICKNEKGQATIEFIIIAMLLFMVLFGAVDYWTAMLRVQQGEHIKNYYMDRARITGCLSEDDRSALTAEMAQVGLSVVSITAPDSENPVVRDINNYPVVSLNITTKFIDEPFMLSYFLGRSDNPDITFSGRTFSEYVE